MSNEMSRSKSRWKGALLAAAATAVISPLAAKAQTATNGTLSVGITTNPLGSGPQSSVYIDPYDTDTLYVYATVIGSSAPSASYVDGLNYLYFNVNAAATGAAGVTGSITAATPSTLFGGGAFNQSNNAPGAGAQGGALSAITTTPSVVVGSSSLLGSMAKPRSAGDIYVSGGTGSNVNINGSPATTNEGNNIIVNGDSVSFLVETLTYTPEGHGDAVGTAVPTTFFSTGTSTGPTSVNSVVFNVSTPSSSLFSSSGNYSNYVPTNYFVGLPGTPGTGSFNISPGSTNTSAGNYTAGAGNVTLTNALDGDANLDGTVNFTDFQAVNGHYNGTGEDWATGDFNNDGDTNFTDFQTVNGHYNNTLGASPSFDAAITSSEIASLGSASPSSVPEPASLGFVIGGVLFLGRRRRRII